MAQITISISNPVLSGFYKTVDANDDVVAESQNSISHSFDSQTGKEYRTALTVTGSEGSKYKISVTGGSASVYPTEEQTLANNRDDYVVRTTG
ncbi:hypothetical protein L0668_10295 [Paraglaciecola aquimarina]|uniref:Uncharacterized protein n=1 Tax=Paraglaciecola algarum TaxID=3050085 RepID=A0ABS9D6F1_9ALTE|nr:hypothetical protein [Paraglaciecola sp. G1-23]MCF2948496.1 hypothetical protein [Paraglaciecola sp. G1-23]